MPNAERSNADRPNLVRWASDLLAPLKTHHLPSLKISFSPSKLNVSRNQAESHQFNLCGRPRRPFPEQLQAVLLDPFWQSTPKPARDSPFTTRTRSLPESWKHVYLCAESSNMQLLSCSRGKARAAQNAPSMPRKALQKVCAPSVSGKYHRHLAIQSHKYTKCPKGANR